MHSIPHSFVVGCVSLLAGCYATNTRDLDTGRARDAETTDASTPLDAFREPDAAPPASCGFPTTTVSAPDVARACVDVRVPMRGDRPCSGGPAERGTYVEVTSATGDPILVTVQPEGGASPLCVAVYDDCACGVARCEERGEPLTLESSAPYQRLLLFAERSVRVQVCNAGP